ncbi:DUF885 domain-containing protein [Aurantivibrio plasticivorans]
MRLCLVVASFLLVLVSACGQQEAPNIANAKPFDPTETNVLAAWLDEEFATQLNFSPQWKTQLGDKSDYDKLDDPSITAQEQRLQWHRRSVAEMESRFDYLKLSAEGKDSYDLWRFGLERAEMQYKWRTYRLPFVRGGAHAYLPNFLINFHKIESASDAQDYIARLDKLDDVLNTYLSLTKRSADKGIRAAQFNYQFAIDEIQRVVSGEPFDSTGISPLWKDISSKVTKLAEDGLIDDNAASEILASARDILLTQVGPAYDNVANWLDTDRKNAPPGQGVWSLPEGDDYYDYRLSLNTTTQLTADEIHQIGLTEVERLRSEMQTLLETINFDGTLDEFFIYIREDPDNRLTLPNTDEGRQQYIDLATQYLDKIKQELPNYFGILPKADLIVKRVEPFREQDGAAQHYYAGAPDGSRPGIFYAHLSDMNAMPVYQLEVIAYHEGNPGHHMQISIAQELTDIPRFRTQSFHTAYVEGWALYSEFLAKEMGFYQDPISDFGRLTTEMWRAIRLVVDTGLHAKQWSEEDAVQYFLANSPQPETTVRSEVQRYLSNPGQATAYKIGMLEILQLRKEAKQLLGEEFDIRGFHDTVLGGGSLPLPVLRTRIFRWISNTTR